MTKLELKIGDNLQLPTVQPEVTAFLETRRSNLAKMMIGAGPSEAELSRLLKIAARVPDHRKLAPWRFIVFKGDARRDIGVHIRKAFEAENPDMPEERKAFEAARFLRAPIVVAVVSAPVECPRGTPEWEQILSSGAVCYNLVMAAQSLGFAAQWLTEWYSYNEAVTTAMGLTGRERIAGLIYMGDTETLPTERARPDLAQKVQLWKNA